MGGGFKWRVDISLIHDTGSTVWIHTNWCGAVINAVSTPWNQLCEWMLRVNCLIICLPSEWVRSSFAKTKVLANCVAKISETWLHPMYAFVMAVWDVSGCTVGIYWKKHFVVFLYQKSRDAYYCVVATSGVSVISDFSSLSTVIFVPVADACKTCMITVWINKSCILLAIGIGELRWRELHPLPYESEDEVEWAISVVGVIKASHTQILQLSACHPSW